MCDICGKSDDDPIEYGEFMEHGKIRVHYYCLLLSTHLEQLGGDRSGILGFQVRQIKREIKHAKKRVCYYCQEHHASIKCEQCKNYFHLVCGLKNNCLFQFVDNFPSYCHEHHNIKHPNTHKSDHGCYICRKSMGDYNPLTSIMSKCCSIGWAHRRCLKEYALAAGYYLKCIWCENKEFRNHVRFMGIFVPDRDARWEKEKNAYADFYKKHSSCNFAKCLCPKGRKHISRKWKLYICSVCGGNGVHGPCFSESIDDNFICKTCERTFRKTARALENKVPDFSMYMSKTQCTTIDDIMFNREDTISVSLTSSEESLLPNKSVQGEVQEKKIEKKKEIFLLLDETNKNIIGLLEGTKNPACNLHYIPSSEIDCRPEDVYFKRSNSIENGYRILDETLQNLVKKYITEPKNKKNEIIEVESDSEQSASALLNKMIVGDKEISKTPKATDDRDKEGSDIDLNEPGPSSRFTGKNTNFAEDITVHMEERLKSDKKEEIAIFESNERYLSATQRKNMLDNEDDPLPNLRTSDLDEKETASTGFGLGNNLDFNEHPRGDKNDMRKFMLCLFWKRMQHDEENLE